ncbi:Dyp-type peroxidase [Rhizobium sp. NPDC090275]|uniref:Dyp-type peroxidase n=1 Tax=Rhizobium sp. NPDC090275 TaxID=3364498 RepID=UPI00383A129C
MATVQTILSNAIAWQTWIADPEVMALLSDLQANILKGHGRDHTANVFVSFDGMKASDIAALLKGLSFAVTSALDQLCAAAAFKSAGVSGGRVVCVFLSAAAYAKLGAKAAPADVAFNEGMRARGNLDPITFPSLKGATFPGLNDEPPSAWEAGGAWTPGHPVPDAMILIADDDAELVASATSSLKTKLRDAGAHLLGVDIGLAQRRRQTRGGSIKGEGIEHFGYVDGRSQPLFLAEDIDENRKTEEPKAKKAGDPWPLWDESFLPSQFIVPDPAARTKFACGSYFVYRKLEQNVEAFKRRERQLAGWLGEDEEGEERAGALVVGRFEDGTPVVLHGQPVSGEPTNNFNYTGDTTGELSPFRGHIRKTNPRTAGDDFERRRIMARRGITFGERAERPEGADFEEDDRPSGGVGLIFMAYMNDINEQFEFTQAAWAGNADFPGPFTGIDPVIGQQANRPGTADVSWIDGHVAIGTKNPALKADFDFKTAVRLIGGEYFFAPSISFLQQPLP